VLKGTSILYYEKQGDAAALGSLPIDGYVSIRRTAFCALCLGVNSRHPHGHECSAQGGRNRARTRQTGIRIVGFLLLQLHGRRAKEQDGR
jgi:hypothetical protein